MYRIVLHLGLPKTATTSLQLNVLMPLHREGEINYLGRYKTALDDDYFNPFGNILRLLNGAETSGDYSVVRERLESRLVEDRVNVISEESLTYSRKYKETIPDLSRLLRPYHTQALISLREPTSFLYSYYVELFRWKYHSDERMNTLEKFVERVESEPDSDEFDVFFYHRLLANIERSFPELQILLFEDLRHDPESYFGTLSEIIDVDSARIRGLFFSSIQNARIATKTGKRSERVTLDQKIAAYANRVPSFGRRTLRSLVPVRAAYYKLLKMTRVIPWAQEHLHHHLSQQQTRALRALLCADNHDLCDLISEVKMKEYGYL